MTDDAYNPLDPKHLGESVAAHLLERPAIAMEDLPRKNFPGAGVYAIYYRGYLPAYASLSEMNQETFGVPIYVGKAVPEGSRTGFDVLDGHVTTTLSARLKEHRSSVRQAENLEAEHFWCRWIVVEPIWIPLGESVTINRHKPLWNSSILDGFGNHDPGSGRIKGVRSRWDTIHPGRKFAAKYPPRTETPEQIAADAVEYVAARLG